MIQAAEIETVIRAGVQDFDQLPIYIIWASDLADRSILPTGCRGLSGQTLDLTLKQHLEHRDLWEGRGPAIIIDEEMILSDARKVTRPGQLDLAYTEGILAVTLHELAHHLEEPFDLTEPDFESVEVSTEKSIVAAALWSNFPSDVPEWFGHEAIPFMRTGIHLRFRLLQSGISVGLPYIFGPSRGTSDVWAYSAALGDEPRRLVGESFATIRATPALKEFIKQWRADVVMSFSRPNCPQRWANVCLAELEKYREVKK